MNFLARPELACRPLTLRAQVQYFVRPTSSWGVTDIDQDMLYQQFRDTADQIYDSVTGGYYYKVNLDAALASVIQDRHADTGETATDIGVVAGDETIEGTIGRISDVDAFEFTAQHTGQVTL